MTASPKPVDVFEQLRPRLFGIAYRMLSDAHEAEDLVQECFLRWHEADHSSIISPEGWLVAVMTRLSIDRLRRAEVERISYVGHWLPEPIGPEADALARNAPDAAVEVESDLSIAFLMLLERLAPEERAAFLLRELFETDYAEIARIVDRTPAAVRQMVKRARERVREDRARFAVPAGAHERLLARFLAALNAGDQHGLLSLFADDATFVSDGGGRTSAVRRMLAGAATIVRMFMGIERKWRGVTAHRIEMVNGEPTMVTLVDGKVYIITAFATDGTRIHRVYRMMNPDKLARIGLPVVGPMPRRERRTPPDSVPDANAPR